MIQQLTPVDFEWKIHPFSYLRKGHSHRTQLWNSQPFRAFDMEWYSYYDNYWILYLLCPIIFRYHHLMQLFQKVVLAEVFHHRRARVEYPATRSNNDIRLWVGLFRMQ